MKGNSMHTDEARTGPGGAADPLAQDGDWRNAIERAAALIADADALVIAAGAGMGVDSGLPDFRGNAGFWKAYPALAADGTAFMDIASPAAFRKNARRAWGFYGHRLALYRNTTPHVGFQRLQEWGAARRHGAFVFTSNVDGHFQRAGFDPLRIDECHGAIDQLQCLEPCSSTLWPADSLEPVVDTTRCALLGPLPACPHCGGTARPNILMFDDIDWIGDRRERQAMRCSAWLKQVRRPVVIEIGAGMNVPTVRHFARRVVLQHGGSLIRINPREHHIGSLPGIGIAGGALATLNAIDAVLGIGPPPSGTSAA
jgi:NAD-dependent SIR2 family protein deacetylase